MVILIRIPETGKHTSTLKCGGKFCINLSRRHRPITVAILQCCTVGVKVILQQITRFKELPKISES
jgi:hypothetical protein